MFYEIAIISHNPKAKSKLESSPRDRPTVGIGSEQSAHKDRHFNISADPSNAFRPLGLHPFERLIEAVEEDRRYSFIESRIWFFTERFFRTRLPLHIAVHGFQTDTLGLIAQKGSPLIAPFNSLIVPLLEGGFFAHWFSTALMQLLLLHKEVVSPNRLHAIGQLFSSKGDIFYGNPMTTDLEKQRG
ncbi:hypothetical protein TYRP_015853, partial [Tyrophagus putrescentiae]